MSWANAQPDLSIEQRGQYMVLPPLAAGGMASLHIARRDGALGVVRICALKVLHPHIARDKEVVAMLLDEARLAARIHSVHVPAVIEIASAEHGVLLATEYVHGANVSELRARLPSFPLAVAVSVAEQTLEGLHAAHEALGDEGRPLHIVHRDVSPQNVLVGFDGIVRVVDFGIARATMRTQTTQLGQVKGKFGWMAPEQLVGGTVDRRADLYAVAVMLWEMLAGQRMFALDGERPRTTPYTALASTRHDVPARLDEIVERALRPDPDMRFATALEMLDSLRGLSLSVTPDTLGRWTREVAADLERERHRMLDAIRAAPARSTASEVTAGSGVTRALQSNPQPGRSLVALAALLVAVVALVAVLALIATLARSTAAKSSPPPAERHAPVALAPDDPAGPIERADLVVEGDTVLDRATGLEWQRLPSTERFTFDGAESACARLSVAGRSGFRVPTRGELLSIVDAHVLAPSIAHDAFAGTPEDFFWSSTPAADLPLGRWSVFFFDGAAARRVDGILAVRCVRGGHALEAARLHVETNDVVDTRTSLRWERSSAEPLLDQKQASSYCAARGKRLPSVLELESIVDVRRRTPAIDAAAFPGTPPETFWSISDVEASASYGSYAWSVSFDTGEPRYAIRDTLFRVRCVAPL